MLGLRHRTSRLLSYWSGTRGELHSAMTSPSYCNYYIIIYWSGTSPGCVPLAVCRRFVEQSNTMLEQRNDTFKSTTAHSQAKVLQLEQQKVALTTELSQATAQLGSLQLELSGARQADAELKQKLAATVADAMKTSEEWASLKQRHEGDHTHFLFLSLSPLSYS